MGYLDLIKQPTQTEWVDAWEKLAALTDGIEENDPRFGPVMAAWDRCDVAFEHRDWPAFQREVEEVWRLCANLHGTYEAKKRPKEEPGKEEPANSIKVGSCLWYRLPGKPEVGPCQVTSLNDLGWHMVQIVENGKWAWVHRSLLTRVQ